ncbi:hypothetical protein IWQ57_006611, partial [Coemansia nantahalensis]
GTLCNGQVGKDPGHDAAQWVYRRDRERPGSQDGDRRRLGELGQPQRNGQGQRLGALSRAHGVQ